MEEEKGIVRWQEKEKKEEHKMEGEIGKREVLKWKKENDTRGLKNCRRKGKMMSIRWKREIGKR